jgi:hypothetical protein
VTEDELIVWVAVADWLGKCDVWFECDEGTRFQEQLFSLSAVPRELPSSRCSWLPSTGFKAPQPSPLVAYRLELIHARLRQLPRPSTNELIGLAGTVPGKIPTERANPTNGVELDSGIVLPRESKVLPSRHKPEESEFERWLHEKLRRLYPLRTGERAICEILSQVLNSHCPHLSADDVAQLERTFFHLQPAADTSRLVGIQIPDRVRAELLAIAFTTREVARFPALAYRFKTLRERLGIRPVSVKELMDIARSFPLTPSESAAIDYAKSRRDSWLRRTLETAGYCWTEDLAQFSDVIIDALSQRTSTREVGRKLGNALRAHGVLIDADSLVQTEMAQAGNRGAWSATSSRWSDADDPCLFRQTAADSCRGCLWLYKQLDGTPRLYRRRELDPADEELNFGHISRWRPKVGATHEGCRCAPWHQWHDAMASIVGTRAPEYAGRMHRLGLVRLYAVLERSGRLPWT